MRPFKRSTWNRDPTLIRDWLANAAVNTTPPLGRGCGVDWFFPIFCTRESLLNLIVTLPDLKPRSMLGGEINHFWGKGARENWPVDSEDRVFFGQAILAIGNALFPRTWRNDAPNFAMVEIEPVAPVPSENPLATLSADRAFVRALAGWEAKQALECIIGAARLGGLQIYTSEYLKRQYEPCPREWWIVGDWSHLLRSCSIIRNRPQATSGPVAERRLMFVDAAGLTRICEQQIAARKPLSERAPIASAHPIPARKPAQQWSDSEMTAAIRGWVEDTASRDRDMAWRQRFKGLAIEHGWDNRSFRDHWPKALGSTGQPGRKSKSAQ